MIKNIWIKNELERVIEIEEYIGKRNNEAIEKKRKKLFVWNYINCSKKFIFFNFPFFIFSYMFFLNKSSILSVQMKIEVNSFSLKMN